MQAQSQKEIEKGLEELEKTDPEQAKKVRVMMKHAHQQTNKSKNTDLHEDSGENNWGKLPPKNLAKLSTLPKENFSSEKLKVFIADIHNQLNRNVGPQTLLEAKKIYEKTQNDPVAISRSAVAVWYKNNAELALLLAAKAAELTPANAEILNSLGAILNLSGFGFKAIPVLQYLNVQQPKSSTVLNNLGQAYLSLGEQQLAEQYLLQSVAVAENHVEANKSLALIYKARGQTAKAKVAIQKSLKGAYSETSKEIASELGISEDAMDDLVIKSIKTEKAPEYFNTYKYQIPLLCESVQQAREAAANHKKFQVFLEAEIKKYETLANEEEEKIKNNTDKIGATVQNGQLVRIVPSPLFEKGKRMFFYWMKQFEKFASNALAPEYIKYSQQEYALNQEYGEAYAKINMRNDNSDHCPAFDQLANSYLPKFAANQQNLMDVLLIPYRGYMDELIYWSQYFSAVGEGRARIYGFIKEYLNQLLTLSRQTKIIFPACTPTPVFEFTAEKADTIKAECPIKIVIPFGIGKLSFTCTQYEFEAGEGLIINYSGSFKRNSESTLAIGPGYSTHIPGVDLGAKGQFYIVFDANNVPSDGGFKMEAGAESSLGPMQVESKVGYTLGVNSGLTMESVSGDKTSDLLK